MSRHEEQSIGTPVDQQKSGLQQTLAQGREWVFLTGRRMSLAGGILLAFFVVVVAVELWVSPHHQELTPLFYLSSAIIGGNFTLLTIVISINQLVISQQLNEPGEVRDQIQNTLSYRGDATDLLEDIDETVAPVTPSGFLRVVLEGARHSIHQLPKHDSTVSDEETIAELTDVLEPLESHIGRTAALLEQQDSDLFDALLVTLNTNYSEEVKMIWRLQAEQDESLPEEFSDSLEELIVRLEQIDVARHYLKSIYIQEELSRLSRRLLYVGAPVILLGILIMQLFIASDQPVLTEAQLSYLTPVFSGVSAAPLAVLISYVLRLSIVSERTAAIIPFTTQTQEDSTLSAIPEGADD